jgi:hypothetical protein
VVGSEAGKKPGHGPCRTVRWEADDIILLLFFKNRLELGLKG